MKQTNIKKTKEQFIQECINVHGNKYIYDNVVYLSNKKNVEIVCPKHGSFLQIPKSHLSGSNCPKCSNNINVDIRNSINKISFYQKVKLKHGEKYNYDKVEFINMNTHIIVTCPTHGDFSVKPSGHLNYGCKKCYYDIIGINKRKSQNDFISDATKKHNSFYDYSLVDYISNRKKVIISCPIHGHFKQCPANHLIGQGCPVCKKSRGETSIESFLIDNHIEYTSQYKFYDCRNINPLPFDFYLPNYNICIEYDGKQHFVDNDRRSIFFSTDTIINDEIKNNYCLNNNIILIRIPYTKYNNIEKILYEKMNQYKKITQKDKNEKFIKKAREIFGYRYDYSKVDYVDANTHVTIIYSGKEYRQTPTKHLQGKKIENTIKKISDSEFIEKSKLIWGKERFDYSKLEYLGTHDHIRLFDNVKNKWISQTAKSHLSGYEVVKYDVSEYKSMCNLIYDYKYNYDNIKYESLISRIEIVCPEHGPFELKSSSHLLSFSSCPKCKDFIGEREIAKFLKKYHINYSRQHKFPNCRNIFELPFDFYIASAGMVIEFDGLQHFQPVEHFGGIQAYETLKINDKIKSDYCEENYINLIRIKYTEFESIEKILINNLRVFIK